MNHIERIVAELEAEHPGYQVWAVPRAVGGFIWAARLHSDHSHVLNASTADDLAEAIGKDEVS